MGKILNKKIQREKFSGELENLMAEIRIAHDLKRLDFSSVYNNYDPNFKGEMPLGDLNGAEAMENIPEEFKKALNFEVGELQDGKFPVVDSASSRHYEDHQDHLQKYYRAKAKWFFQAKLD